jgi:hypothetical protein
VSGAVWPAESTGWVAWSVKNTEWDVWRAESTGVGCMEYKKYRMDRTRAESTGWDAWSIKNTECAVREQKVQGGMHGV